jgi:D-3-phosphoglycerate dehydrogenase
MKQILITTRSFTVDSEAADLLRHAGISLVFSNPRQPLSEGELLELLTAHHYEGIIAGLDDFNAKVIETAAPSLKIIARFGVGFDTVDLAAARASGVVVTNTPGANSVAVAELAFGLMICLSRNIVSLDVAVRSGSWERRPGRELAGKTVGLMGTGAIGEQVAQRCRAFDMKVIACDPFPRADLSASLGLEYTSFDEILKRSDFVSLHTPVTSATKDIINKSALDRMQSSAFLINTGRGGLIKEDDLYAALVQRRIAGAGLDVFVQEPPLDPRFFKLDNVVLTPHIGGISAESNHRMGMAAAQEIVRVLSGQPPLHPISMTGDKTNANRSIRN